jgi:hypothetical protein
MVIKFPQNSKLMKFPENKAPNYTLLSNKITDKNKFPITKFQETKFPKNKSAIY